MRGLKTNGFGSLFAFGFILVILFMSPHEMKEEIETTHFEHTFAVLETNRAAEPLLTQTGRGVVRFTTEFFTQPLLNREAACAVTQEKRKTTSLRRTKNNTAQDPGRLAEVLLVVILGAYTQNGNGYARM